MRFKFGQSFFCSDHPFDGFIRINCPSSNIATFFASLCYLRKPAPTLSGSPFSMKAVVSSL